MKKLIVFLLIITLGCKNETKNKTLNIGENWSSKTSYAEGFNIQSYKEFKVLTISDPWPDSERTYKYALIQRDKAHNVSINKDEFDGVITIPVESVVVTSTSHIPALELLEVEHSLTGFPGCDYISSKKTRKRIENGAIRELGKNEGINTEVLLEINPDVVVGFGVDGINKTFETISKANIPVVYNGDWVEKSALAKAEWIKFFGALYDKETKADSIFKSIEYNYREAQRIAKNVINKPTIISGAMYKDLWYLPNGTSPEAQILKDANVDYLWQDTNGSGSLALSFETVFNKAKEADIWLSPSYYNSYESLENSSALYTQFDAFKNKKIYTFTNTKGETGGVLYYELGTTRPDLVLKDIIKVCHPEILPDYSTTFFKPLE